MMYGASFSVRDVFDATMAVVALLCASTARRIGPFFNKRLVFAISGTLLVASTAAVFATGMAPGLADILGIPAAIAGGAGIALLILL